MITLEWYVVRLRNGKHNLELRVYAQDSEFAAAGAKFQAIGRGAGSNIKVLNVRKEGEPDAYLQRIKKLLMSEIVPLTDSKMVV